MIKAQYNSMQKNIGLYNKRRNMRIGLLGGSFDPAHDGHLYISKIALKLFNLNEVWWLVTPQNPLKLSKSSSLTKRINKIYKVISGKKIRVESADKRYRTIYTYHTLKKLLKSHPVNKFIWIMGADNLKQIHKWNLNFADDNKYRKKFEDVANRIDECLKFMEACGINDENVRQMNETDFYTSHEALLLPYEEALTRVDSTTGDWYDVSAHMLWVGDRTRQLDGAHIEFVKGIQNPLGLKIGPSTDINELLKILEIINPNNLPGRVTLICRMGADKISSILPNIIKEIKKTENSVVWACDPMHGNTIKSSSGYKTRPLKNIISEIEQFFVRLCARLLLRVLYLVPQ